MSSVKTGEILSNFVQDMIFQPKKAILDVGSIDEEYRDTAKNLVFLHECLNEVREFAGNLGRGNLDVPALNPKNALVYPLKALHSSLKHIAWQAKQIEKGDLNQTIDSLGEFSKAFNDMRDELKRSRTALETQAYRDPLTMLFNRAYMMKELGQMVGNKNRFSVCFVDLDNLKYINDTFGHGAGDNFIIGVSDRLTSDFPNSIAGRIGGDEFLLLLPEKTEKETKERIRETCLQLAHFAKRDDGKERKPLSFGIVEVKSENELSAGQILAKADAKMYALKAKHKAEFQDERRI